MGETSYVGLGRLKILWKKMHIVVNLNTAEFAHHTRIQEEEREQA